MGQNNRKRRADKAKARARHQHSGQHNTYRPRPDLVSLVEHLAYLRVHRDNILYQIALPEWLRADWAAQLRALTEALTRAVGYLGEAGWTPDDLAEYSRRQLSAPLVPHVAAAMAQAAGRHPQARTDHRWTAQVARFVTDAGPSEPQPADSLFDLLVDLHSLPRIDEVLPPPGRLAARTVADDAGVDANVLRKVRGLLAKAESTIFAEEADALTAKAQQMMSRYSIDRALAMADAPRREVPAVRRIWLEAPYVSPKSMLVGAVAHANNARSVLIESFGFVTVVGFASDLDLVELLTTSLLVQATRSMRLSGPAMSRSGRSETRSFRQSFLVAYAGRIGERLHDAAAQAAGDADAELSGRLLPVLAGRAREVEDDFDTRFPHVRHLQVGVTHSGGYGAGRAAADLALFDHHGMVEGERTG